MIMFRTITNLLILAFTLLSQVVLAEEEFCLSGGFSSGYSCAADKALGSRKALFSVQILAQTGAQDELMSRLKLPLLDSILVSDSQSFYYLGNYPEIKAAWDDLQRVKKLLASEVLLYRPTLVSYARRGDSIPRIRMVEQGSEKLAAKTNLALQPEASNVAEGLGNTGQKDLGGAIADSATFYAVELQTFKTELARAEFVSEYSDFEFYCRRHSNGVYTSYLGIFEDHASASEYLQRVDAFAHLNPHIIKLSNVEMIGC
jgi:hypothetical protein